MIMFYYQMSNPSICIPKVDQNINKKFIYDIFNRYNFGEIRKIDMVKMNRGFKVFIHFKYHNYILGLQCYAFLKASHQSCIIAACVSPYSFASSEASSGTFCISVGPNFEAPSRGSTHSRSISSIMSP